MKGLANEVLAAWFRWAEKPGNEEAAQRCERACRAIATELGTTATEFRISVINRLHVGQTLKQAIRGAINVRTEREAA